MKKIKLCLVTDTWYPLVGGGPQVVLNYAQNLTHHYNYSVEIITRNIYQNGPLLRKDNIKLTKLGPKTSWNNPFGRLLFLLNVYFYLLKNNYDLIHAFPVISGIPCLYAAKIKKIPLVYSVFALLGTNPLLKLYEIPFALLEYIISLKIPYDYIITDNKELHSKEAKYRKNILYLENGVDTREFDKVTIPKPVKNRILFVGRFHKQKGIETLLHACALLKTRIEDFELHMIGYGHEEKFIRQYIDRHGLKSNIVIRPPQYGRELIKEYKQAQFLVLPSLYEGTGIVVLESLAAGRPVIITSTGSLKYIIRSNMGRQVKPGNAFELYWAMYEMLMTSNIKKGAQGYRLVKDKYQWQKIVHRLNNFYRSILD